jgi:hypothetical protein
MGAGMAQGGLKIQNILQWCCIALNFSRTKSVCSQKFPAFWIFVPKKFGREKFSDNVHTPSEAHPKREFFSRILRKSFRNFCV